MTDPRRWNRAGAAVTLLLLAACSTSDGRADQAAVGSAPAGTPAPPSSPAPVAADGTDLSACVDAECQVLVSGTAQITPAATFGLDGLLLAHIAPRRISIDATEGERVIHCDITGTGYLSLAHGLTITVEHVGPVGAIVRFTPEAERDNAHVGSGTEGFSLYEKD